MAAPTYIIYREGDALAFFPAKESDELFDALRAKYPHLKTHSERMRDAIIEFLMDERNTDATEATAAPSSTAMSSSHELSPWQQSLGSTANNSPETVNLRTPSFVDFTCSSPSIEGMTSVFSLSSAEQPKQRLRRKMTEAEKVEYRKRRIMKACDKCAKRKRKCTHNQQSDNTPSVVSPSSRVCKTSHTSHSSINLDRAPSDMFFDSTLDDNIPIPFSSADFDDFTLLAGNTMLDYDNLYQPDDVNSFDLFSTTYAEADCIDPRQLSSHHLGTYTSFSSSSSSSGSSHTSPSSAGTSHLPSPIISTTTGELDSQEGLHCLQESDEHTQRAQRLASGMPESLLPRVPHQPRPQLQPQPHEDFFEPLHGLEQELHQSRTEGGVISSRHGLLQRSQTGLEYTETSQPEQQHLGELQTARTAKEALPSLQLLSTSSRKSVAELLPQLQPQDIAQGVEQNALPKETTRSQGLLDRWARLCSPVFSTTRSPALHSEASSGSACTERNDLQSKGISSDLFKTMALDNNIPEIRSGLASARRTILKEATRACTPRGAMSALGDPSSLFAELTTPPTTKGSSLPSTTLDNMSIVDRLGVADDKRHSSASSELFKLRRRISPSKDHQFSAHQQRLLLAVNPATLEIPSPASSSDQYSIMSTSMEQHSERDTIFARPKSSSSSSHDGLHVNADLADGFAEAAALTTRYKEYQRIDRFWVRDHHGRFAIAIAALALLLVLVSAAGYTDISTAVLPALACCCIALQQQGSLGQDQSSAATRTAQVARKRISFLRHMASSGLSLMCVGE